MARSNASYARDSKSRPGTIVEGTMYTLDELRQRTGWGARAMREAREAGLEARYWGGRAFFLGRDVIKFVSNCPVERRAKQNT